MDQKFNASTDIHLSTTKIQPILIVLFILGLLVSFFPWLFSYQGFLFGQKISLRAMGNFMGLTLACFGLFLLFSSNQRKKVIQFAEDLDLLTQSSRRLLMWGSWGIYLVGIISHKLCAQYNLGTHAYDLGFFSNICWNTANGNWFFSSDLEQNFMAVHVNWILWPLSIFYKIFPTASVLLIAQAVLLALSIPILWKMTHEITADILQGHWLHSYLFVPPILITRSQTIFTRMFGRFLV